MPEETVVDGAQGGDGVPAVVTPPVPVAATPPSAPAGEKTMMVPHSAMKRIKEEEFSKGREAALEQLAKDAGYESHADFVSALARLKAVPAQTPAPVTAATPTKPQHKPDDSEFSPPEAGEPSKAELRALNAAQRNLEKALNERNRYATNATEYRKQLEDARAELDAVRAEMHLRTVAAHAGVQDVDYAITLLTREVERLTPEEAEKFDERAFFNGLRSSKPLLFGEEVRPANTGIVPGGAPKPPAPGKVASTNAGNGKVDARQMNPKEYADLLRARGISAH